MMSSTQLPPISSLAAHATTAKSLPILPKPITTTSNNTTTINSSSSQSSTPSPELQRPSLYAYPAWSPWNSSQSSSSVGIARRLSDPNTRNTMSSEEVLAEKRRRNAGASARFRDRRKQREREIQDRCRQLEQRTRELEEALRRFEPDNALLQHDDDDMDLPSRARTSMSPPAVSNTGGDRTTLNDRVSQLEHMMDHFRQEKETDAQKLKELEKENVYLKSLLVPVHLAHAGRVVPPSTPPASVVAPSPPHFSSSSATTDEDPLSNKRPRLSSPSL